jgi:DNA-binding NtrC family response regulator
MTRCDVLVIDDEPVVRDAVRRVLEANGFRVATANDAATGLSHPALGACRLVLCDLMLPDRSGIDVLQELAGRRPGLPVVLITGYATPDHAVRAREAGAAAFLAKPFEAKELMACVEQVLVPRRATKEKRA